MKTTAEVDRKKKGGGRAASGDAPLAFSCVARSGSARAGAITTPHGAIDTPAFMPVGTHGAVKAMTPDQVRATGSQIVLGNTYHLTLRPGEGLIAKLGGLHEFMRWPGPILTDSGGFQVFSIPSAEIHEGGVRFKNELTGEVTDLTPERSIQIQNQLGADIIMAFDECTPYPAAEKLAASGVRRTLFWAERCARAHERASEQALFGIVQGSTYLHLRESCAQSLVAMDLPGYAIGGVSVGEGHELMCRITSAIAPMLPEGKPRYLMGVGLPEDLVAAVGYGMDMFDCVIPTRYARSATVFTSRGRIRLSNRRFRRDSYPIDPSCDCAACAGGFTRAYLHHLFAANEVLSAILCSIHNVHFYQRLMREARTAILEDRFEDFTLAWKEEYTRDDNADAAKS
jgi:queuine tRNA-ribosyltransferase